VNDRSEVLAREEQAEGVVVPDRPRAGGDASQNNRQKEFEAEEKEEGPAAHANSLANAIQDDLIQGRTIARITGMGR